MRRALRFAILFLLGAPAFAACGDDVTLEAGQTDEYTMLNWMSIVPVD